MLETTANEFRKTLKEKVETCIRNHEILKVRQKSGVNFIVLGEEDWCAIEETLYLNHVPGLVKSIHSAATEPPAEGTPLHEIDW